MAFEILVRQHQRSLMVYAQGLMASAGRIGDHAGAEDLLQDALVVAFENLHRFDHTRSFPAWVRGIMRFRHLKNARNQARPVPPELLDALDLIHDDWQANPDAEAEDADMLVRLTHCLKSLSKPAQQAIEQFYMRRQPVAAIASSSGDSLATVRKRLQRGREALFDCMKKGVGHV
jgi:RNA polymerase sigma-70 factor (ECF subfamily)